jgi:hypothetical protein
MLNISGGLPPYLAPNFGVYPEIRPCWWAKYGTASAYSAIAIFQPYCYSVCPSRNSVQWHLLHPDQFSVFSPVRDQPNVASEDAHITSDLGCVDSTHCGVIKKIVANKSSKLAVSSSPIFRSAHSSYLNLCCSSMIFIYFASPHTLRSQIKISIRVSAGTAVTRLHPSTTHAQ